MLPLGRLLQLVPKFTEGLKSAFSTQNPEPTSAFFSNPEEGPIVVDTSSLAITVIIKGSEVPRTIIDGASGVNVISQLAGDTLGIREWGPCPLWLWMADTSLVRPTGLIWNIDITIGKHAFRISVVVLQLNVRGAYPLLLGRSWLRTKHIKQIWQKNVITFQRGKTKVRVSTQEWANMSKQMTPLYAESIDMLDGLADDEIDWYLDEHPNLYCYLR